MSNAKPTSVTAEGGGNDARLERIQGGIDVLRTMLEAAARINDERHTRVTGDVDDLKSRVHRHGNELMVVKAEIGALSTLPPRVDQLERDKDQREGERKGVAFSGRTIWAGIMALVGGGGIVGLMKLFGG